MEGLVISDVAKDLIINIINIILLFVIIRALVYKPVRKFLNARTEKIEKMKSEADEKSKEAEKTVAEYKAQLEKSKQEETKIIAEAQLAAKEQSKQIVAKARSDAKQIVDKARNDSQKEHDSIMASMQGEISKLAVDISEKILARDITDEDNRKIAEEFFKNNG